MADYFGIESIDNIIGRNEACMLVTIQQNTSAARTLWRQNHVSGSSLQNGPDAEPWCWFTRKTGLWVQRYALEV